MKSKKLLGLFICALLLAAFLPTYASAAGNIDTGRDATLTITEINQGTAVRGAKFDLYYAASISAYYDGELSGSFQEYPVLMEDLDTEGWDVLAETLSAYAQAKGFTPIRTGTTDASGALVFDSLTPGLYLAVGHAAEQDGYRYTVKPLLVLLPGIDPVTTEWLYEVTVTPKLDKETITPVTLTRKVLKVWDDGNAVARRPSEITASLLRNGVVYDTVTLNAANGWTHTWTNLESSAEWTVVENDVGPYFTTVVRQGITFVITNKTKTYTLYRKTGDDDSTIEIPDDPTPLGPLPQTGQLWWPVPILAAVGLFFLSAGVIIRKRDAYAE